MGEIMTKAYKKRPPTPAGLFGKRMAQPRAGSSFSELERAEIGVLREIAELTAKRGPLNRDEIADMLTYPLVTIDRATAIDQRFEFGVLLPIDNAIRCTERGREFAIGQWSPYRSATVA